MMSYPYCSDSGIMRPKQLRAIFTAVERLDAKVACLPFDASLGDDPSGPALLDLVGDLPRSRGRAQVGVEPHLERLLRRDDVNRFAGEAMVPPVYSPTSSVNRSSPAVDSAYGLCAQPACMTGREAPVLVTNLTKARFSTGVHCSSTTDAQVDSSQG